MFFYDAYESFYHGFMIGILSNIDRYIVKSNYKETPRLNDDVGFHTKLDTSQSVQCRSDILIRYPNRRGKAVIIELKVATEISELEEKCDEALKQNEKFKPTL